MAYWQTLPRLFLLLHDTFSYDDFVSNNSHVIFTHVGGNSVQVLLGPARKTKSTFEEYIRTSTMIYRFKI